MSAGSQKRTRLERVAALELPPNFADRFLGSLQRGEVWLRIGLCLLAAIFLWIVTSAWAPPFSFRSGYVSPRDIMARVEFKKFDPDATHDARVKGVVLRLGNGAVSLSQAQELADGLARFAVNDHALAETEAGLVFSMNATLVPSKESVGDMYEGPEPAAYDHINVG